MTERSLELNSSPAGLFESVGELEDASFAKGWAKNLQADGQFACPRRLAIDIAAGDGDAGDTGERAGHGVNIGEIHLERVARAFAQLEGRNGRSGCQDGVHFGEGIAEVLRDKRADLLALQIVSVVVAGGEDIRAEDDAALDFGAEPGATGFAIHGEKGIVGNAEPVAHAVVAREVGAGL